MLDEYLSTIEQLVRAYVHDTLHLHATGVPRALLSTVCREWDSHCNVMFDALKKTFINRLQKEIHYGTMNHFLTSKFKADEVLPDDLMDSIVTKLMTMDPTFFTTKYTTNRPHIVQQLTALKEQWTTQFAAKSLHEQQQQHLFHAIKAVWVVEHKTFVDSIMKETTELLLAPTHEWVTSELFTNKSIIKV